MICNADFEELFAQRARPDPLRRPDPAPAPDGQVRHADDGRRPPGAAPAPRGAGPDAMTPLAAGAMLAALPMLLAVGQAATLWGFGQRMLRPGSAQDLREMDGPMSRFPTPRSGP
jgi:hypothetical protein